MFAKIEIAQSLLSANFMNLERDLRLIEQARPGWLHVDVMDGHFVPNLTIGPPVIKLLKKITNIRLDVHLMIDNPAEQLDSFIAAGADLITVHLEAGHAADAARQHPAAAHSLPGLAGAGSSYSVAEVARPDALVALIKRIHAAGIMAGIALNPGTPASAAAAFIDLVDLVMVMSVHPGFGGQGFIESTLDKLAALIELASKAKASPLLEVDGGINAQTAALVAAQGADLLVAGNAIFCAPEPVTALNVIRRAAESGRANPVANSVAHSVAGRSVACEPHDGQI